MTTQSEQETYDNHDSYRATSEQLDHVTTTVITTLLSGFIVVQSYLPNEFNEWYKAAAIFAIIVLLFHFISFITAHFAQIYKAKSKKQLYDYFSQWTIKINYFVYALVVVEFVVSILLLVFGK